MGNQCKSQFRCRNFGFYCTEEEHDLFYVTEWSDRRLVCLIYRIIICLFQLGWFIARHVYGSLYDRTILTRSHLTLTAWSVFISTVYFILALILSIIGTVRAGKPNRAIKALRSVTWLIHTVIQTLIGIVVIIYWTGVAPNEPIETKTTAVNIHSHGIVGVLFIIEIFIVAFPFRLLHVVYPMCFGCVYAIFTLIYHGAGVESAIYSILDWAQAPGLAAGLAVGLVFAGIPFIHCIFFGLYCLRMALSKRKANLVHPISSVSVVKLYESNPTLERENEIEVLHA